jgi:hypothetical protein
MLSGWVGRSVCGSRGTLCVIMHVPRTCSIFRRNHLRLQADAYFLFGMKRRQASTIEQRDAFKPILLDTVSSNLHFFVLMCATVMGHVFERVGS